MNTIKKALKRTEYEFDVPLSEVQTEIQDIIDECYNSNEKEIHDSWRQICPNGEKPTPEQLITYVTDMIKSEQNDTLQTSNKRFNLMHLLLGRFLYMICYKKDDSY
ncbi:hypothetical protein [Ruminococcus flavefaciens]|uniref:hypothetical protein n=1 Tax=Ruminococcus flavefaciens TaxID=1265 RepID=UPI0013DC2D34|nr:hypothetical protein [Ruminococcus flavefaciens]